MKRRILALLLVLSMCLGLMPGAVFAAEAVEEPEGLTDQVLNEDGSDASAETWDTEEESIADYQDSVLEVETDLEPELEPELESEPDPEEDTDAQAYSMDAPLVGDGNTVSRVVWLNALTQMFEMTVEDDNYPDNYFSDLTADSDHYYDMLLAVEFGLIDIEPGGEIQPDAPVTREFAAHTLNFCLGLQLEDSSDYTYSDSEEIDYPEDVQIALNRGWFQAVNGKFNPNGYMTAAEMDAMLVDAQAILQVTADIDESYENSYVFSDDVVVISADTMAEIDENGKLTIYEPVNNISVGDTFVVFLTDLPSAYRAVTVKVGDDSTIIQTAEADVSDTIVSADAQGVIECSDVTFIPEEGVTVIDTAVSEENGRGTKKIKKTLKKDVTLTNGVKVGLTVDCQDLYIEYLTAKQNGGEDYIAIKGDLTVTTSVAVDFVKLAGGSATVSLGRYGVPGVGEIALVVELELNGKITYTYTSYVCVGVAHSAKNGFRTVARFEKKSFSMCSEVAAAIGLKLSAYLNAIVIRGDIYVRAGLAANLKTNSYTDGILPMACTTFKCWLYAEAGYSVTYSGLSSKKDILKNKITIYDYSNSPVKLYFHIEDGVAVQDCARNPGVWTSPANTSFGYYSSKNASSSGYDAYGNLYTIYTYDLDDDNNATITGYQGNVSALIIPETLDGYTVVGIGDSVFRYRTDLRTILIPDTVTSIGTYAFANTGLTSLTLPKNLTSMEGCILWDTVGVKELTIPKTVTNMCDLWNGALEQSYVEKVIFESGITRIPDRACEGATYLTAVTIPDTVTSIGGSAFKDCTSLTGITLPDTVTSIGGSAFKDCTSLTGITLPDTVTSIGTYAFANTGLTSLTLPKNLTSMEGCILWDTVGVKELTIPKTVTNMCDLWNGALEQSYVEKVIFESGITRIPDRACEGATYLTAVTIPDTVTSIGDNAFKDCTSLKEITVPDSVTEMGTYIFANCSALKEVKLPKVRYNITDGTFQNCTALEKITLPDTVTRIGKRAFEGCAALKEISWVKSLSEIDKYAFKGCSALTKVTIPEGVKYIYGAAFEDCDGLTTVEIPDSVTLLGDYAFYDSDALTTVKLGSGLTEINKSTFEHCDSLKTIQISRRVKSIGENAFKNCVKLAEVTIPRATTEIASTAFSYPDKMTIYGVAGTYAETFAKDNGIKFVDRQTKAAGVTLNKTDLTMNKYEKAQLSVTVKPEDFTDAVTWKSSNTDVVTVDDNGYLKAQGVGTATVKVSVGDFSATCKVTVRQPVSRIYLNQSKITLEAMENFTLTAQVSPDDAYDKTCKWSSSDTSVATVDKNGVVTALKKGTATITATANGGTNVTSSCTVTVTNNGYTVTDPKKMESSHNYQSNCSDFWIYSSAGAKELKVTFDAKTEMEDGYDFLVIYDKDGNQVGSYTGTALAGKTITVPGDTVKIQLKTDDGGTAWGFKVTGIAAVKGDCSSGHKWDSGKVTTKATCEKNGVKTYTCTNCGGTKTETIKATGHKWNSGKVTTKATCTKDGVKTYTCANCEKTKTEKIAATGHSYETKVVKPTCTEKGYTLHTCKNCSDSYKDTYVDATGHSWDKGTVTKAPTATEKGVKTYTCKTCGKNKTEEIAKLSNPFTDLKNPSSYYDAVLWAVDKGITKGTSATEFSPKADCTRAQIVTFLWRYAGEPEPTSTKHKFVDIVEGSSYYKAVLWAVEKGITNGLDETHFGPKEPCTRAQIVTFLWRAAGKPQPSSQKHSFTDIVKGSSYYDAVLWAVEKGITTGADTTHFNPKDTCTRAQGMTFLYRYNNTK